MKYIYQIINIPWFNSTVDVWPEGSPELKQRLKVIGFRVPSGHNLVRLKEVIQFELRVTVSEVEEFQS